MPKQYRKSIQVIYINCSMLCLIKLEQAYILDHWTVGRTEIH